MTSELAAPSIRVFCYAARLGSPFVRYRFQSSDGDGPYTPEDGGQRSLKPTLLSEPAMMPEQRIIGGDLLGMSTHQLHGKASVFFRGYVAPRHASPTLRVTAL